jgi:hypothetical protein
VFDWSESTLHVDRQLMLRVDHQLTHRADHPSTLHDHRLTFRIDHQWTLCADHQSTPGVNRQATLGIEANHLPPFALGPSPQGKRSYSQNRHFNFSTMSLSSPPNPEH